MALHILEKQLGEVYNGSIITGRNKKSVFSNSAYYN